MSKRAEKRIGQAFNRAKKELEHIHKTDNRERPVEDWCYDFLINVLGYEKYNVDYQAKTCGSKAVDIAIKDDKKQILWLCECKKMSEKLGSKWEDELQKYCCECKVEWGILTNGISWAMYYFYHEGNIPKRILVYKIQDILHIRNCKQDRNKLYPFCAEAVSKQLREKLLEKQKALSCECLGCALISENVLTMLSKQIKKAEGITIKEEDLAKQIKKLIPQFKDLKISRRFTKKKSYRKTNNSTEEIVLQESEEIK